MTIYVRNSKFTFSKILKDEQLDFFCRNGNLYIGEAQLSTIDRSHEERLAKKQQSIKKSKIAKLKFDPLIDDVGKFRDEFNECFEGLSEEISKVHLKSICAIKDKVYFDNLSHLSLAELLHKFFLKYENQQFVRLNQLKNTSSEKGIENFINERFKYYDLKFKQLPFKTKLKELINDLPSGLKEFLKEDQLPSTVINTKERLIDFLKMKLEKDACLNVQLNPNINSDQTADQSSELKLKFNCPAFFNIR